MNKGNGVLVLVLGILGFAGFGFLTGLPAWILGNKGLEDIRRGIADPSEEGMIQVGRILGIIVTILSIAGACLGLLFFLGFFGLMAAGASAR